MVQTSFILSCIVYSAAGRNATLGADCKAAQKNAKCAGTAPFCGGHAGDCGDGWKYDKDVKGGHQTADNGAEVDCGHGCTTGHKVVCSRCIPCVSAGVVKGKWQLKQEAQEGKTIKYKVGTTWGESHTRTETWAQEVSTSAEVGIKVEDVLSASRSVSAKISHSVVNEDKSYWEKNEEKEEDYTFTSNGDMYQWIYEIEDGCPPTKVAQTEHTLVTKKGPPCCIPGYFGDIDNPDSAEAGCRQDSPNLCIKDDGPTEPPTTTPEPQDGPDGCAAGAEFMDAGTAPFCEGHESDCKGDWIFLEKVSGGDHHGHDCGKKCWTGSKVLCYRCKPAPPTTVAPEPETTEAPETTQAPEPETTEAPETTQAPEPETAKAPDPETTKAPEPETTKAPETTEAPEPDTTKAPKPEPTKAPEPETTKPETTKEPEPETTKAPQPETTFPPKPETTFPPEPETTVPPETAPPGTTVKPAPYPGDKACRVCDTMCSPCQACVDSQEGECEKCWHCWDYDDDELEKDDEKMDKKCDALHKDHDWDDDEVRCLTNRMPKDGDGRRRIARRPGMVGGDGRRRTSPSAVLVDCRACWNAGPQSTETTV